MKTIKLIFYFFHRGLKRLFAIDFKLDRFKAAYKGQMELYLKWPDKYERKAGEETTIGLILVRKSNRNKLNYLNWIKDKFVSQNI